MSTTFPSIFSIIIHATTTPNVTSFTAGKLLSVKSAPGIWLKPFAASLAWYTPFLFSLNTHLHPTNLQSSGWSFLFTCLHTPMSNVFLNSRQIASLHFSLDIKSGSHQASWNLCGSSGSDIVLVTKPISCNHSFMLLSSLASANALISGLDPSACLVLAAIGSLAVVWLLVLEAMLITSHTNWGLCWFFCL